MIEHSYEWVSNLRRIAEDAKRKQEAKKENMKLYMVEGIFKNCKGEDWADEGAALIAVSCTDPQTEILDILKKEFWPPDDITDEVEYIEEMCPDPEPDKGPRLLWFCEMTHDR